MSLMDNNNGMVMPVSPMYGGGRYGNSVAPSPRPAYIVQNPNCCAQQTFGCGCGAA